MSQFDATAQQKLEDAAQWATAVMERMSTDGSISQQVANGDYAHLSAEEADALASHFESMAERIRFTREMAGDPARASLTSSVAAESRAGRLPMNRKERYFTGTVLPMIVASEDFTHLPRFLRLCGLSIDDDPRRAADGHLDLQFFTEYGFGESVYTEEDRLFWSGAIDADTPDLVIAGEDWLLAVEAKVFHDPNGEALTAQMSRQAKLVDLWSSKLSLQQDRVRHVLLLPERLADRVGPLPFDIVTWESVVEVYDRIGPRYWVSLLRTSLDRHGQLESRPMTFGRNADKKLDGATIVAAFADATADFNWVGRKDGIAGASLRNDLESGSWRTTVYEVCTSDRPPNRNWFALSDFVAATGAVGH